MTNAARAGVELRQAEEHRPSKGSGPKAQPTRPGRAVVPMGCPRVTQGLPMGYPEIIPEVYVR